MFGRIDGHPALDFDSSGGRYSGMAIWGSVVGGSGSVDGNAVLDFLSRFTSGFPTFAPYQRLSLLQPLVWVGVHVALQQLIYGIFLLIEHFRR
ncbi:hypothetical protein EFB08_21835 [Rufibacter latericius]|uniref:Uncharacterized protein n=1 Tax=Rufibacter latericius TaxID=2487040 RepID=A0A3M9M8A8_9BACT|nr:hypothetical protein EFB08_21835 [Rufibacter latericius]